MDKQCFRIGELAQILSQEGTAVEPFVIRFWERQFNIRAKRSDGGQRFYSEEDLYKFTEIKELLYVKKFTIAGAKKFFEQNGKSEAPTYRHSNNNSKLLGLLADLRKKLYRFKTII
ncbi:MAG: MerR family transcriptional regulator [Candidatus Babeliaceae bacterium]|nr:MerR family transcriptional regulator [Candidatus Babeliaceae bacterium]